MAVAITGRTVTVEVDADSLAAFKLAYAGWLDAMGLDVGIVYGATAAQLVDDSLHEATTAAVLFGEVRRERFLRGRSL
jgi:hypothetical protein